MVRFTKSRQGSSRLGCGSGVDLARLSSGETVRGEVRGDPFLARVHSTKAVKSSRGPSSDDSTLLAVFRLASRRPGSWWRSLHTGTVLYCPREICPPAPAGGGGIRARRGDPWGHNVKKKQTKKEGRHMEVTVLGQSFCHVRWSKESGTRNSQNESF